MELKYLIDKSKCELSSFSFPCEGSRAVEAMVKDYVHESRYAHPWSSCVRAYFLRYPNPNAQHVLSVDVLDRRIEYRPVGPTGATMPVLCTTRLILKRGNLPKWAPAGIIKNAESYVMEESEVELDLFPARPAEASSSKQPARRTKNGRAMRSWTRNLDHTTILAVTEGLVFKERFGLEPHAVSSSLWQSYCKTLTSAQIESQISFGMLRRRIEKFGLARFVAHKDTSQQGILWTRSQLEDGSSEDRFSTSTTREEELQRSSIAQKRFKLLESLRPPFLDGYPLGPWQKLKVWWYSGHYSQVRVLKDGYPIERDLDEQHTATIQDAPSPQTCDTDRFRGAAQDGPWAGFSGRKGKGTVYSEHEWDADQGVLNQVRRRFGLPPQAIAPERPTPEPVPGGPVVQFLDRTRHRVLSLLGYDSDNLSAKEETKDRIEVIDRERTV